MIANHYQRLRGDTGSVVVFLEALPLRRSSRTLLERAQAVGVSNRLKAIPDQLRQMADKGTADERRMTAKRKIHDIQKANQQIVVRAEEKRMKQTQLPVTRAV